MQHQWKSIIFCSFLVMGCNQERVFNSDIDKLTIHQMKNNQIEIDDLQLKVQKTESSRMKQAVAKVERLQDLHESILNLNNSIDRMERAMASRKTAAFIEEHFQELTTYNRTLSPIDFDTPKSLMKLHVATLEAFIIRERRDDLKDYLMRVDSIAVVMVPTKLVVRKGDKISGKAAIALFSNYSDTKSAFRTILINGKELKHGKDAWEFELDLNTPSVGPIVLNAEAIYAHPNNQRSVQGKQVVYIQE